ncbi:MAG: proton-conducting transporter membrane subunit [Gemella sp.]|nr:proton-conducting transporter membrane subunit [Gemella sp.]
MLHLSILLPLFAIFLIPVIKKYVKNVHLGSFVFFVPATIFAYFLSNISNINQGATIIQNFAFASNVGLDFNFRLDGLSQLFTLLISGIGTLVILYSVFYMEKNDPKLHKFYIYLMMFMTAMLGLVLSDNLLSMYMFWEFTSVSSFLLISYWHENDASRRGALKSLIITVFGGMLMLLGIIILRLITGSFNISEIIAYSTSNDMGSLAYVAMVLIIIGAFSKSAQFPFHIWLPDAMAAPTPISSYLHSATMVKAGIYLLLRTGVVFSFTSSFSHTLIVFGAITMLLGSVNAVFLKDLKSVLAYSTISQLGMMTLMIGIGNLGLYNRADVVYTFAFYAVTFHIINHAAFKASLFMVTGIIDHTMHSRDISMIRGLRAFLPVSFVISILGGMSMAGVPPFSGFYSKEFFLNVVFSLINVNPIYWIVVIMTVAAALGTFVYSMILAFKPFLGEYSDKPLGRHKMHLANKGILISPAILAVFTIANNFFKDVIVIPAQKTVVNSTEFVSSVHHDHLLSPELVTTIVVIILGAALYIKFASKNVVYEVSPVIVNIQKLYDKTGELIYKGSEFLHNAFITNKIRRNMSYIFVSLSATIILGYFALGNPLLVTSFSKISYFNIAIAVGIAICCVALSVMTNRLVLIMTSSGIGFMMTAIYVSFKAPDLAMTQFVIESISTIIFLVAFILLTDKTKHIEAPKFKLTNAVIAALSGISFTIVGLVAWAYKNPSALSGFFKENVIPSGGGNIVNVIIVDFRGFDTLFEVVVMAMVALIVYAMFKLIKKGANK